MRNLLRLPRVTWWMIRSRSCAWVVTALALCFYLRSRGARHDGDRTPDFDALVVQADYIVRAVVKSMNAEWRIDGQNRSIVTKVELTVSEVIKGTPPAPLVLEILGGRIGRDEMRVDGAPKFRRRRRGACSLSMATAGNLSRWSASCTASIRSWPIPPRVPEICPPQQRQSAVRCEGCGPAHDSGKLRRDPGRPAADGYRVFRQDPRRRRATSDRLPGQCKLGR